MHNRIKLLMWALLLLSLLHLASACKDPNCTNCLKDPNVCKACPPGFRLTENRCDRCDDPNCTTCKQSENFCSNCQAGYRAFQGRCQPCQMQHCAYCPTSVTNCLQCQKGFKMTVKGCASKALISIN